MLLPYVAMGAIPARREEPMEDPGKVDGVGTREGRVRRVHEFPRSRTRLSHFSLPAPILGLLRDQDLGSWPTQRPTDCLLHGTVRGYLGCPPYFPLWLAIFHGRAARVSEEDGGQLLESGGITFQV
jgi:hypothetical protein